MTDRELLELAAKACGWRVVTRWEFEGLNVDVGGGATVVKWNPLTDDGDAIRLAVARGIRVSCDDTRAYCDWWAADGITLLDLQEIVVGGDKLAATRRAIVRAAAEIGKDIP